MRLTMIALLTAAAAGCAAAPARCEDGKDIRDLVIGMKVADLPQTGYVELVCAAMPEKQLDDWNGYASCPPNAAGQREVRFQFGDNDNPQTLLMDRERGTRIGGHPVLISILISKTETVTGIVIETDPKVRLYLKKKAFLMGLQIRERYGVDGWTCINQPPAEGEEAVGGQLIKERCEKQTPTRHYVYDRQLLQRSGQTLKDFISMTRLSISAKE